MDDSGLTPETTITPPCEQLSDIICDLELKIKEYEKNSIPKYLNEVQELEDKLKHSECENKSLKDKLNQCSQKIVYVEQRLSDQEANYRSQIQRLDEELKKEISLQDGFIKDNRLLAREIERYEGCIREATVALENNNMTVLSLEQENQELKLQLREKQKESSNLRDQLSQMAESQDRLKHTFEHMAFLSERVSKVLENDNSTDVRKETYYEGNSGFDPKLKQTIQPLEELLERYSQMKLDSRQSSIRDDLSSTKFYQSGNFEMENTASLMKKVPSVPILNSKVIAQLKEAKERELGSLHSSVRILDSRTKDTESPQKDIIQQLMDINIENRRLSNALSITNKQFNAANLEKKELTQELSELKSTLQLVVEAKALTESQYQNHISQLQSVLAQNKVELNATILRLQKEIEVKTKLADEKKQTEDREKNLEVKLSQCKQEVLLERERSRELGLSRDNLQRQLNRTTCINEDLKMMISHREERIKELSTEKHRSPYNQNEIYKKNLTISLQNFKKDIQDSLSIREKLKTEQDKCFQGSINRLRSPYPNPKIMSRLEMVQELKVRMDVIQKINSN